jgi:cation-transporting ATPase E
MVLHTPGDVGQVDARARADTLAAAGSRVLLLAAAPANAGISNEAPLPADLSPAALVVLAEHVRDDAEATLRYFTEQGVAIRVLSGDNPRTVGAVAAALHLPGVADAGDAVDARTLPEDLEELAAILETHSVFGRVTPHQKRTMVKALQSHHVVAMTGDGVNDALALKEADIGIAMGNGTPATRAVAQVVLLDGSFAHLPQVVGEGRRVIANIERAASLFLVKNVYALVLALIVTVTGAAFGYQATRVLDHGAGVTEARTTATLIVLIVSLWTLLVLARPLSGWKLALVAAMAAGVALIVAIPTLGHGIFLLDVTPLRLAIAGVLGAGGALLVELTHRSIVLLSRMGTTDEEPSPESRS